MSIIRTKVMIRDGSYDIAYTLWTADVATLNRILTLQYRYEGHLRIGNSKLNECIKIKTLPNDIDNLEFYPNDKEINLIIKENGYWESFGSKSNIEQLSLKSETTLTSLIEHIYNEYKVNQEQFWIQLYKDGVPVFMLPSNQTSTLKELNFKSSEKIYVDFLPNSIYNTRYDLIHSHIDLFKNDDCWKMPTNQDESSQSTFLSVLKVLHLFFQNPRGKPYMPHFFYHLSAVLKYNPAVNCLFRMFNSKIMVFERYVIAKTFYFMMVYIICNERKRPTTGTKIDDSLMFKNVFKNFPQLIFSVLNKINLNEKSKLEMYKIVPNNDIENQDYLSNNKDFMISTDQHKINLIAQLAEFAGVGNYIFMSDVELNEMDTCKALYNVDRLKLKMNLLSRRNYRFLNCRALFNAEELTKKMNEHYLFRFLSYTPREIAIDEKVSYCLASEADKGYYKTIVLIKRNVNENNQFMDINYSYFDPLEEGLDLETSNLLNLIQLKECNLPIAEKGINIDLIEQIIVFVLDCGSSMNSKMDSNSYTKRGFAFEIVKKFTDQSNRQNLNLAVGLIEFNTNFNVLTEITRNFKLNIENKSVEGAGNKCLWPAIRKAADMIENYEKDQSIFVSKNTIKRIICITDGCNIDNNDIEVESHLNDRDIILNLINVPYNNFHFYMQMKELFIYLNGTQLIMNDIHQIESIIGSLDFIIPKHSPKRRKVLNNT